MKVLVLGHKGMLGRAVYGYLQTQPEFEVLSISSRWGEESFGTDITNTEADFIINCIGKIPQKNNPTLFDFEDINISLPRYLDTLGISIIHPSTDCEFNGDIPPGDSYTKNSPRNAIDPYGSSKAIISEILEKNSSNTKIIRTSIIGHEENSHVALLDWFLNQTVSVKGFTNHYWNGITTLEWAKQCQTLIESWESYPILNQLGTETHYSKFELISLVKEIYKKDTEIIPFETDVSVNKCLATDKHVPELTTQIAELKAFFKK